MEPSHIYGVELSRLRNLSSPPQPPRKIHFRLESDTLPVRDSYLDLYVPEFHQYGSREDRATRHLDISSTWRSLSAAHAEELKFWEDMFAAVLEYTVSNHLIDLIDSMDDCNIDRYPGDLDGRICSFANRLGGNTLPVNAREIISCMMELYKRHGSQYQWLASSGNFYNALCEFLRTRDCFLDTPLHPTIKVSFSASLTGQGEPSVVGVLKRFGPLVGFTRLDTFTSEDAWCHIYPSYVEPVLDSAYPSFLGRPEYRLASDWIKFNWENDEEGFRGYVRPIPHVQKGANIHLNIDLTAVSKRFFPGGVVFERNIRVRINLSVCRLSNIPTVSPVESMPVLQRYKQRQSLFNTPPGIQDLSQVMKANNQLPTSSPIKPIDLLQKEKRHSQKQTKQPPSEREYLLALFEQTRPQTSSTPVLVNTVVEQQAWSSPSPAERSWGKNVPAWDTIPEHSTDIREAMSDVKDQAGLCKNTSYYREQEQKGKEKLRAAQAPHRKHSPSRPSTSLRYNKLRNTTLNPFRVHERRENGGTLCITSLDKPLNGRGHVLDTTPPCTSKCPLKMPGSSPPSTASLVQPTDADMGGDEHVAVQPTQPRSPQDLSESNAPLEMKHITRPKLETPRHTIIHYPGTSYSPKAPISSSVWPASAPHPLRRRVDSVLGIRESKRPSSAVWVSTDSTMDEINSNSGVFALAGGGQQYDSFASWVRWRENNDNGEAGPSSAAEQTPQWYGPPPDVDVRIEQLRRDMKEWYDAMVLKRDTPRRRTKEEKSEEEAYGKVFLGGDSGEEGDMEDG